MDVDVGIDDQGRSREYVTLPGLARWEYEVWDYGHPAPVESPADLMASGVAACPCRCRRAGRQ